MHVLLWKQFGLTSFTVTPAANHSSLSYNILGCDSVQSNLHTILNPLTSPLFFELYKQ